MFFAIRAVGSARCFLLLAFCHASCVSAPRFKMPVKKDVASSSAAGQSGKNASGVVYTEKPVDKLNVGQFCERFCIPNDVSVLLVDGEAISTEKFADNAIYFSKEQFNAGLRFALPSLFKEFLHFIQIPPTYIHPNIVRVLMGCNILNMLFNLDLSLLEVLFIYSIKNGKTDFFCLFVPPIGDSSSRFDEEGRQGTYTSQGCLGWTVGASGESVFRKQFTGAPG